MIRIKVAGIMRVPIVALLLPLSVGLASCGDSTQAPRSSTDATNVASPTSDPDFSTWLAVGDWARLRGCTVYDQAPASPADRGRLCDEQDVVSRIIAGPHGNGRDFPFYEVDGIGWVYEGDLTDPVDAITFVSADHGWALVALDSDNESATYAIWETQDGGDTWLRVSEVEIARGLFDSLDFTDDLHGWIHAGPYNNASVLATEDGGTTWNDVWQSTEPYGNDFESYTFPTTSHGWRIIPTHLQRTTDGGRTWLELRYPCDAERQYTAHVSFIDGLSGFVLCGTTYARDDFQLFRSLDGGDTWEKVESQGPSGAQNSLGTGATLTGMKFLNAHSGWIATSGDEGVGGLFQTKDGGLTWHEVALESAGSPPFWRFEPPEFVDEMRGWIVVSRSNTMPGNIYRTSDGGVTWELTSPPGERASP